MSNGLFPRWYCRECKREWVEPKEYYMNSAPVSITGNPLNGKNCQVCGSPEIELVQFKPQFPGLDIPRDGTSLRIITPDILEEIPSLVGSQRLSIRADIPKVLREHQEANELIAPALTNMEERVDNKNKIEAELAAKEEYSEVFDVFDNSDMD